MVFRQNKMQPLTWQALKTIIERLTCKKNFLVAFSGGLDSQVLLWLLVDWAEHENDIHLRAIHINHGLSPNANSWNSFCETVSTLYHIPFLSQKIFIQTPSKEGIEAQARRLRYDAIAQRIQTDEVLLTAHHQNDQVETMLLQWMRGAGPKGLAAMPAVQPFNETQLIRPLLSFSRQMLHDFAIQHQLEWVVDESNKFLQFKRNYVREKIMPPLLAGYQGNLNNLTRTAAHCAEAVELLAELADMDLKSIPHDRCALTISNLLRLNPARQRNVLRRWLTMADVPVPTTTQMNVLQNQMLTAARDAEPLTRLGDVLLRRYQQRLYITPIEAPIDARDEWVWDMATVFNLPQRLGTLRAKRVKQAGGLSIQKLPMQNLTVRFRRGGERMHPSKRSCATSLKQLFQEWKIPPWQRDRWPLLFYNEQLIAVVNKDVDCEFVTKTDEEGWQLMWQTNQLKEEQA